MGLQIIHLAFLFSCAVTVRSLADPTACERQYCGDIEVVYPFGLGEEAGCSKDESFVLNCDRSTTPPTLILGINVIVLKISLEPATAIIQLSTAYTCYNTSGISINHRRNATLEGSPFTFSTRNRFFGIGCDTVAYFSDAKSERFTSGCVSVCSSNNVRNLTNPINFTETLISCSGMGCCQSPVPEELRTTYIRLTSFYNHSSQLDTNPCNYAFLADPMWYNKSANFNLVDTPEKHLYSEAVLDWALPRRGNMTCEQAQSSPGENGEFICGDNTSCIDSTNSPGYHCACKKGFEGNPYSRNGCADIDECSDRKNNTCITGKCINTPPGNYTCQCSFGKQGDGKIGCRMHTAVKVIVGVGAGVLLVILLILLGWRYKKNLQERNHLNNGGLLLDHLSVKSFKESQLAQATNNFDTQRLLGEGGNGWVYRGSLPDMMDIAVKKSKVADQNQIEQFLNEVDIVSKINHKNVVKLVGVCLESKVPILIYEYVPNGTLYHHLHGKNNSRIIDSWCICVRIAAETARALEYMHSLAHPPIIHRDVKTSNILLDGTYTAKVADFGASKLIPLDRTMAPTQGQGTMGYLDPEYVQTGELTTKSDVYGFGVVLMELLTKQKPISRGNSGELISLVKIFTSAVRNNQLDQVLKVAEVTELETEQVHLVAMLAIKCVAMPSTERPTMTEVADQLNRLSKEYYQSFPVEGGGDEMVSLLDDQEVITTSVTFDIE